MTKYQIEGTIVDTGKAKRTWEEDTFFDGRNMISKATDDQWTHETLYLSSKGRFYLEHTSQWQGSHDWAEFIPNDVAVLWLINNGHSVPDEFKSIVDEVVE